MGGLSGKRWKAEHAGKRADVAVTVRGYFLLVPLVSSLKSVAENESGARGSGDLKWERVRSGNVSKWTQKYIVVHICVV